MLFRSKDRNNLENELKKTTEWLNYQNLYSFDCDNLYNNLLNDYIDNKKLLYFMFNYFNKNMLIKTKINSDHDLYNYLLNSKKYFKKVAIDYRKRMFRGSRHPLRNFKI